MKNYRVCMNEMKSRKRVPFILKRSGTVTGHHQWIRLNNFTHDDYHTQCRMQNNCCLSGLRMRNHLTVT